MGKIKKKKLLELIARISLSIVKLENAVKQSAEDASHNEYSIMELTDRLEALEGKKPAKKSTKKRSLHEDLWS